MKTENMNNTDLTKKSVLNPGAHEWYAVPASNKIPVVLLMFPRNYFYTTISVVVTSLVVL